MQNKHEEDLFDNANQFFLKNRFLNFKFKERVSIKIFLRFTLKLLWISTTLLLIFTLQYMEQDIIISQQLISTIYSNALCVKMFALIFLVIYLKSVKRGFGSVQTLFSTLLLFIIRILIYYFCLFYFSRLTRCKTHPVFKYMWCFKFMLSFFFSKMWLITIKF